MDGNKLSLFGYILLGGVPYFILSIISEFVNPTMTMIVDSLGYGLMMSWTMAVITIFFQREYIEQAE